MNIIETSLVDAFIIEPRVFGDHRGWFMESYNKKAFTEAGIDIDFVQDNRSFSQKKGTLRGLHCQTNPKCQAKLVTCIKGAVMDVIVDIREGSPSYLKWIAVELSEENKKQFYIPQGFAHGFLVLSDVAEFCYKCTDFYHPGDEGGLLWSDPDIGVDWPIPEGMELTISEKDTKWGGIKELKK